MSRDVDRRWMKRSYRVVGILVVLLGSSVVGSCGSEVRDDRVDASLGELTQFFQAELESLRAEYGFPGATAAFILPDGRLSVIATGVADREAGVPLSPQDRMLAGSVGKTFVSAVVLALVQEELLTLDAKIATWLGDEKWFGRLPNGQDVTLRMLLTHTSGIPEHYVTDGFLELIQRLLDPDNLNPDTAISPEQMVAHILDREPLFPAGSDFEYADTNYILVGMIIEKVSGRTYYDELQRRFLAPLDLTLTSPSDRQRLPGVVPGYLAEENFFGLPSKTMTDGALVMNPALEWTGGGLASNPRDLVRWARVLYEGEALPEPYLDELLAGGPPHEFRGEAVRYGLGVTIRETDLGMTYGHSGWFPGYSTVVRYYAKYRLTVAIQINTDHDSGCYEAVPRLARVVLDNTIK